MTYQPIRVPLRVGPIVDPEAQRKLESRQKATLQALLAAGQSTLQIPVPNLRRRK